MASLAWLSYHKLVGVEYAKTKNPELLPYVLEKAQHQLLLRKHLLDIHDFLQERHIPYVVLKGIPLNQQLYGNKMLKYSGDIDILVDKKDFLAAHTCLLELGYELQSPLQVETVMQHEKRLYALK